MLSSERKTLEKLVEDRRKQLNDLDHLMRCTDPHCQRCKGDE